MLEPKFDFGWLFNNVYCRFIVRLSALLNEMKEHFHKRVRGTTGPPILKLCSILFLC